MSNRNQQLMDLEFDTSDDYNKGRQQQKSSPVKTIIVIIVTFMFIFWVCNLYWEQLKIRTYIQLAKWGYHSKYYDILRQNLSHRLHQSMQSQILPQNQQQPQPPQNQQQPQPPQN